MLTQAEIEDRIVALDALMDEAVHEYADLADAAAEARAAWRLAYHGKMIALSQEGGRRTVADREAMATLAHEQLYRDDKLAEARLDAAGRALMVYRTRMEALRTLAANVRALT